MQHISSLVRIAQASVAILAIVLGTSAQASRIIGRPLVSGVKSGVAATAPFATRTVTTTADTFDGVCDTHCSLRDAIFAAVDFDTVAFATPLFSTPQTITLSGGGLQVNNKRITIIGPGAKLLTIDGSGAGGEPVVRFFNSQSSLSDVTVTGGNSTITGVGGGISIYQQTVTLNRVHVTGNQATNAGGGIYVEQGGVLFRQSTLSSNSAGRAGGLMVFLGFGAVDRSTVSANTSTTGAGGGIGVENSSSLAVRHATIVNNAAATVGGGVFESADSTVPIGNSIVALNTSAAGPDLYLLGTVNPEGFNLIGDSAPDSSDTGTPFPFSASDVRDMDPQLGALSDAFTPTPLHIPNAIPTSPVIDQGNSLSFNNDQAGGVRTYDNPSFANAAGSDGTDIGSFERQAPTAAEISIGGRVLTAAGRAIGGVRVVLHRADTGEILSTSTSSFGYYRFDGLRAGQAFLVSVSTKRYTFSPASRLVSPSDSAFDIEFTSLQ